MEFVLHAGCTIFSQVACFFHMLNFWSYGVPYIAELSVTALVVIPSLGCGHVRAAGKAASAPGS